MQTLDWSVRHPNSPRRATSARNVSGGKACRAEHRYCSASISRTAESFHACQVFNHRAAALEWGSAHVRGEHRAALPSPQHIHGGDDDAFLCAVTGMPDPQLGHREGTEGTAWLFGHSFTDLGLASHDRHRLVVRRGRRSELTLTAFLTATTRRSDISFKLCALEADRGTPVEPISTANSAVCFCYGSNARSSGVLSADVVGSKAAARHRNPPRA